MHANANKTSSDGAFAVCVARATNLNFILRSVFSGSYASSSGSGRVKMFVLIIWSSDNSVLVVGRLNVQPVATLTSCSNLPSGVGILGV